MALKVERKGSHAMNILLPFCVAFGSFVRQPSWDSFCVPRSGVMPLLESPPAGFYEDADVYDEHVDEVNDAAITQCPYEEVYLVDLEMPNEYRSTMSRGAQGETCEQDMESRMPAITDTCFSSSPFHLSTFSFTTIFSSFQMILQMLQLQTRRATNQNLLRAFQIIRDTLTQFDAAQLQRWWNRNIDQRITSSQWFHDDLSNRDPTDALSLMYFENTGLQTDRKA